MIDVCMYVCARESLKLARLERVREAVRIPGGYTHGTRPCGYPVGTHTLPNTLRTAGYSSRQARNPLGAAAGDPPQGMLPNGRKPRTTAGPSKRTPTQRQRGRLMTPPPGQSSYLTE